MVYASEARETSEVFHNEHNHMPDIYHKHGYEE